MITEITDGQKLQDGDWFDANSIEELEQIRGVAKVGQNWFKHGFLQENLTFGYNPVYMDRFEMVISNSSELPFGITEYSFEAFKMLCINTFGDAWKDFDDKNLGERLTKW